MSLRKCERHDGIRLAPGFAVTTGGDHEILPAGGAEICRRRRLAAGRQFVFPQFFTRFDIKRSHLGIQGCADENKSARRGVGTAQAEWRMPV
jgi:hypothetical protein